MTPDCSAFDSPGLRSLFPDSPFSQFSFLVCLVSFRFLGSFRCPVCRLPVFGPQFGVCDWRLVFGVGVCGPHPNDLPVVGLHLGRLPFRSPFRRLRLARFPFPVPHFVVLRLAFGDDTISSSRTQPCASSPIPIPIPVPRSPYVRNVDRVRLLICVYGFAYRRGAAIPFLRLLHVFVLFPHSFLRLLPFVLLLPFPSLFTFAFAFAFAFDSFPTPFPPHPISHLASHLPCPSLRFAFRLVSTCARLHSWWRLSGRLVIVFACNMQRVVSPTSLKRWCRCRCRCRCIDVQTCRHVDTEGAGPRSQ